MSLSQTHGEFADLLVNSSQTGFEHSLPLCHLVGSVGKSGVVVIRVPLGLDGRLVAQLLRLVAQLVGVVVTRGSRLRTTAGDRDGTIKRFNTVYAIKRYSTACEIVQS